VLVKFVPEFFLFFFVSFLSVFIFLINVAITEINKCVLLLSFVKQCSELAVTLSREILFAQQYYACQKEI
jgi:hypothetical protein